MAGVDARRSGGRATARLGNSTSPTAGRELDRDARPARFADQRRPVVAGDGAALADAPSGSNAGRGQRDAGASDDRLSPDSRHCPASNRWCHDHSITPNMVNEQLSHAISGSRRRDGCGARSADANRNADLRLQCRRHAPRPMQGTRPSRLTLHDATERPSPAPSMSRRARFPRRRPGWPVQQRHIPPIRHCPRLTCRAGVATFIARRRPRPVRPARPENFQCPCAC